MNNSIYKYSDTYGHQVAYRDHMFIPWIESFILINNEWKRDLIQTIPAALNR